MVFQRRYLVVVEVGHVFLELVEAHESLSMHDTEIMNYESPIMKPVDENFGPLLTHPLHPEKRDGKCDLLGETSAIIISIIRSVSR